METKPNNTRQILYSLHNTYSYIFICSISEDRFGFICTVALVLRILKKSAYLRGKQFYDSNKRYLHQVSVNTSSYSDCSEIHGTNIRTRYKRVEFHYYNPRVCTLYVFVYNTHTNTSQLNSNQLCVFYLHHIFVFGDRMNMYWMQGKQSHVLHYVDVN